VGAAFGYFATVSLTTPFVEKLMKNVKEEEQKQ